MTSISNVKGMQKTDGMFSCKVPGPRSVGMNQVMKKYSSSGRRRHSQISAPNRKEDRSGDVQGCAFVHGHVLARRAALAWMNHRCLRAYVMVVYVCGLLAFT